MMVEATLGLTDLVEAMHGGIAQPLATLSGAAPRRTSGLTGGIYATIRLITRAAGVGVDVALATLGPVLAKRGPVAQKETLVAALNGVLGDHLEAQGNPLATPLELRLRGDRLRVERTALAEVFPAATGRVVLLIHGLCRNEQQWRRQGHDHGEALARDLGHNAVYVRYNTGRHVSSNGRELAELLEQLAAEWPVPLTELTILAHSMGGLVARSAYHYAEGAGLAWTENLRHLVFLGTPHHGAPLERAGRRLHATLGVVPFASPLARLGRIRSAGITDLRHGNLLDEDWAGRDRFARAPDTRRPVPLPSGVRCYAIAATSRPGERHARLVGDGLVPLDSALGRHPDPQRSLAFEPTRQWVGGGINHLGLLDHPEVYERIRGWLAEE